MPTSADRGLLKRLSSVCTISLEETTQEFTSLRLGSARGRAAARSCHVTSSQQ